MPKGYSVNPKRDKRGLTKPQAVFVDNVLTVGPKKAAEMAYPGSSAESQGVIAAKNMKKGNIVLSLSKMADKIGLNRQSCAETIKEGLTATKLYGKEGIEHPDHTARLRAAELGLKIHGELQNDLTPIGEMVGFGLFMLKSLKERGLNNLIEGEVA